VARTGANNSIFTVAAVPEPSTWARMIVGFFGIGFMDLSSAEEQGGTGKPTTGGTAVLN
jgi:hypothetical protein